MKQFCRVEFVGFILLVVFSFAGCKSSPERLPPVAPVQTIPVKTNVLKTGVAPILVETNLFNGKNLDGWAVTDFGGHGEVSVENGEIKINMGSELTGVNWTNAAILPKTNYEIELDAMRREGGDFFCGLTFPVNDSFCSLILGGWGGGVVGISSIDRMDASENETSRNLYFERNRWYHVRVQVAPQKILVWIDQEKTIDVEITGRKISMRPGDIERSVPLGIATWQTSAALKNIRLKPL